MELLRITWHCVNVSGVVDSPKINLVLWSLQKHEFSKVNEEVLRVQEEVEKQAKEAQRLQEEVGCLFGYFVTTTGECSDNSHYLKSFWRSSQNYFVLALFCSLHG
jgi:hypothetical protein